MNSKIRDLVLAVAGMIFVLSAAVIFTVAFKPLYYRDMERFHLSEATGYEDEVIKRQYDELIAFNLDPGQKELVFPDFPMSEEARIHFREVKRIFQGFLAALFLSGLIFLPSVIIKGRKKDLTYLRISGVMSIGFPLIVGSIVALNWERAFILFHEIVFDNDYWLFDPVTDPIIDCLPDEFFLHCAVLILGIVLIMAVIMIILGNNKKGERRCKT